MFKKLWGSGSFQLDGLSIWKSLEQVLFLIASFALTKIGEWLSSTDFGAYQALVIAVGMFLINLAKKFIKDYSKPDDGDNGDQI